MGKIKQKTLIHICIFTIILFIIGTMCNVARADGTGVFINNHGDIMTNRHVLQDSETNNKVVYYVVIDGHMYIGKVMSRGTPIDLAILHIDYDSSCLSIAPKTLMVGDALYPLMFDLLKGEYFDFDSKKKIFSVIVTATKRLVQTETTGASIQKSDFIMPNVVRPGNSGSPVLDKNLNIVAVVFAGSSSVSAVLDNSELLTFAKNNANIISCKKPNTKDLKKSLVWIYQVG